MTTFTTSENVYCVSVDRETLEIDRDETEAKRRERRRDRGQRAVPAARYLEKEREKILKGRMHPVVKAMYRDCFALSAKFAEEFRSFWNLDETFSFE